ncbi:insulinase family protein [Streptomyces sp. NBC_01235]|uniref:insulinase family protein n=1 Tax=Streptomyces sp. NBC_01235 TaxID=2903788 RepID=UPI002E0E18FF|nr:insulinase family protein [Streptomyces sp. NBC_01235]
MREVAPGLGWYDYDGDVGAFALTFPAGFHAEGADRPGLAHFTEHMLMAPRDGAARPYAQLEEHGCLLEAQTRRDHLTVTVSGPQGHLLRAAETMVAHLTDLRRPASAALQQAEIIHNEVLEKTGLAPWSDRWRWCIPTPGGGIGVDHDPVVAPALAGLAVYEEGWKAFAVQNIRLERCSAAVVADPALVAPEDMESVLGPRSLPDARDVPRPDTDSRMLRDEIVLPVDTNDLAGQSAALIAAKLVAREAAAVHRQACADMRYGLFDEWFSENAATIVTVPVPSDLDFGALERRLHRLRETAVEPSAMNWAREQLLQEWAARVKSPSACARSMAWMLSGGRLGTPFAPLDSRLVERSASAAAMLMGA